MQEIFTIVEHLDEYEQSLILEILRRFSPDNIATEDDVAAHLEALAEYGRGESIDFEDIDWN
jgi:hypothetical protein